MNRVIKFIALAILLIMIIIVMVGCSDAEGGGIQFVEWTTSTAVCLIALLVFAVGFIFKAIDGYYENSKNTWKTSVGIIMMISSLGIVLIGFIMEMIHGGH